MFYLLPQAIKRHHLVYDMHTRNQVTTVFIHFTEVTLNNAPFHRHTVIGSIQELYDHNDVSNCCIDNSNFVHSASQSTVVLILLTSC